MKMIVFLKESSDLIQLDGAWVLVEIQENYRPIVNNALELLCGCGVVVRSLDYSDREIAS